MARCSTCQNEYDKTFDVMYNGDRYTFDCFECAIHLLAPPCAHCGCRIIGHGAEAGGVFFCCAHCANEAGQLVTAGELRDRAT
jgi:hypothetical protein